MKMIIITLAFGLIANSASATIDPTEATVLKVNSDQSTIFWTGQKIASQHTGTLSFKKGSVHIVENAPVQISVQMDMQSIRVTDISDPESKAKLTRHLNSSDFFATEQHPTGTFQSTSISPIKGATDREANYLIKGKLTLKEITHEIVFPAFIVVKGGSLVANGEITFDRSKWDIRYGSDSFFEKLGDKAIYDEIKLNFVISAE